VPLRVKTKVIARGWFVRDAWGCDQRGRWRPRWSQQIFVGWERIARDAFSSNSSIVPQMNFFS